MAGDTTSNFQQALKKRWDEKADHPPCHLTVHSLELASAIPAEQGSMGDQRSREIKNSKGILSNKT